MIGSDAPYEIVRADGRCAATGRELAPGERIVVVLAEAPSDAALHRIEFASDAWASGARPEAPLRVFATWSTRRPDANDKRVVRMDDDDLLGIFAQLGEQQHGSGQAGGASAVRYLLALFLMRRRMLIPGGGRGSALVLTPRGAGRRVLGEDPIRVEDPKLTDEQLDAACLQLGELLGLEGAE